MKIDFTDKLILVTGGTRGIGKCIAHDFKYLGGNVVVTGKQDRNEEGYIKVDFTNESEVNDFLYVIRRVPFDICVNCAGINKINYLHQYKEEDWDDIIQVNLKVPFLVTKEISKNMIKQNEGKIVNISSIFSQMGVQKRVAYCSSKFGLNGLTSVTATELAKYNILVNTVSPGFVYTDLTREVLGERGIKKVEKKIPLGKLAIVDDISNVVMFLTSHLNTYITGQNIVVDGGVSNKGVDL